MADLIVKFSALVAGLLITLLAGCFVKRLVKSVKMEPEPPEGFDRQEIRGAFLVGEEDRKSAWFLGVMERMLFFASFYIGAYLIGGGYLGLKAASKWAVWQNILKVSESFPYHTTTLEKDPKHVLKASGKKSMGRSSTITFPPRNSIQCDVWPARGDRRLDDPGNIRSLTSKKKEADKG